MAARAVEFSCPFCARGTVSAGIDEARGAYVAHTQPTCAAFDAEAPGSFMKACNDRLRATREAYAALQTGPYTYTAAWRQKAN